MFSNDDLAVPWDVELGSLDITASEVLLLTVTLSFTGTVRLASVEETVEFAVAFTPGFCSPLLTSVVFSWSAPAPLRGILLSPSGTGLLSALLVGIVPSSTTFLVIIPVLDVGEVGDVTGTVDGDVTVVGGAVEGEVIVVGGIVVGVVEVTVSVGTVDGEVIVGVSVVGVGDVTFPVGVCSDNTIVGVSGPVP